MKKYLRFLFAAVMAMTTGNVLADEVVIDFDSDYKTLFPTIQGESSGSGSSYVADGEFNEVTTSTAVDGVTVTVEPSEADASTRNRIWGNAPRLRLYSGSITFTSATKKIVQMVMYIDTNKGLIAKNNTVDSGQMTEITQQSNGEVTWVGSANSVKISIAGNTQFHKVVLTLGEGSGPVVTPTVITFAEGYQTHIAQGPDGMFPEVGSSVALPAATVMAGDAAVSGATVEWNLEVKSWKEGKPQPVIADGKVSFKDGGYGELLVKASYAGNDSYTASTKNYTLSIYNSYGKLKEMADDIADPKCEKDDEDDKNGSLTFYFFRNIDAEGFPPLTNTVTFASGKYIYLTDGEGNNLLFYGTNTQNLKQGDKISGNIGNTNLGGFWGSLKRYNKLPEFAFTEMNVKVESEGNAVAPVTITADKIVDNINNYVKIENAAYVSADSRNLIFQVGDATLVVYNQFNVDVAALEAGATYTLTGMGSVRKVGTDAPVYQLYLVGFEKGGESGVASIQAADKQPTVIYDLMGRKVKNADKGLYISGGRKMIVR